MGKSLSPSLKRGTSIDWSKAINYIPKLNEIIIYDDSQNKVAPRIKIGDGITKVNDLPFINDNSISIQDNTLVL